MKVAIYCRLSREDEEKQRESDESESIQNLQSNKQDKLSDTEWQWLTFGSNFNPSGTLAEYRKIGNFVEIRLKLIAQVTANTNDRWYLAIQDLPTAIRPTSNITELFFKGLYNETTDVNLRLSGAQIQFKTDRIEVGKMIIAHITYIV